MRDAPTRTAVPTPKWAREEIPWPLSPLLPHPARPPLAEPKQRPVDRDPPLPSAGMGLLELNTGEKGKEGRGGGRRKVPMNSNLPTCLYP